MTRLTIIPLVGLLAGCAAQTFGPAVPAPAQPAPAPSRVVPPSAPAPPPVAGFMMPQILDAPGFEGIMREDGASIIRQLGQPRLDLREGDMRKLQFAGRACVLDIYLYPLQPHGEPVATHAEARRASDGKEVDRAACLEALRR